MVPAACREHTAGRLFAAVMPSTCLLKTAFYKAKIPSSSDVTVRENPFFLPDQIKRGDTNHMVGRPGPGKVSGFSATCL